MRSTSETTVGTAPSGRAVQKLSSRFSGPWLAILPVVIYLALCFFGPLAFVILSSFFTLAPGGGSVLPEFTLENWEQFFGFSVNAAGYWRSVVITALSVGIGTATGYAIAFTIAIILPPRWRPLALLAVVLPFWTSFIVRAFSWQLLLNDTGPVAVLLKNAGLITGQLGVVDTHVGTVIALGLFSMMIVAVSVYTVIEGIDASLLEASQDLGASPLQTFREVILPLSYPGLSLGVALSFIVCFGDYVAPTLLGGGVNLLLSQLMVEALRENFNIPLAAVYAVVLLLTIIVVTVPLLALGRRRY